MGRYLVRRLLWMIPVLFFVVLITFIIMHATPGGPWDVQPDSRASDPRLADKLSKQYGLDLPLFFNLSEMNQAMVEGLGPVAALQGLVHAQFEIYLWNLFHGDLGPSYRYRGQSVNDILFWPNDPSRPVWESRFGTTAFLGIIAMTMALIIGFPLGLIAGLKQNTIIDNLSLLAATLFYGIPTFITGIMFIFIFAVWLGWIRVMEFDYWQNWQAWMLPALTLAIGTAAYVARLTRSSVIETMRQDYVRTARAKGLGERAIIFRHIVRNALIPVVTFIGPALAALVTGSFIIETQFSVNGIGRLFIESIGRRDYSVILALTLIYAFLVAAANLAVDLIYGFLDPRIKVSGG